MRLITLPHPQVVAPADQPLVLVDSFCYGDGHLADLHLLLGHNGTGQPIYETALAASVPVTAGDLAPSRRVEFAFSAVANAADEALARGAVGAERLRYVLRALDAIHADRITIAGPLRRGGAR